jgi:hypothetical protein
LGNKPTRVEIQSDGSDVFVVVDGVKIAKRAQLYGLLHLHVGSIPIARSNLLNATKIRAAANPLQTPSNGTRRGSRPFCYASPRAG